MNKKKKKKHAIIMLVTDINSCFINLVTAQS